jgi:hypothetical protein
MRTYKNTGPVDSVRLSRCFEVLSSFPNLSQTGGLFGAPDGTATVLQTVALTRERDGNITLPRGQLLATPTRDG